MGGQRQSRQRMVVALQANGLCMADIIYNAYAIANVIQSETCSG